MVKKRLRWLASVLLILALFSVFAACDSEETTFDGIPIGPFKGKLAPDFTLNDLDGEPVSLSQFRGSPVLLIFWATWCPQCRVELEYWNTAYTNYIDEGLQILAVDVNESASQAREFAAENGLGLTILVDSDGDVNDSYYVRSLPRNFFIDRDGFIREVVIGRFSNDADWDIPLGKIF